jgi:putative toxin-antitoxin system antitoxin component (TIGR02293 family)
LETLDKCRKFGDKCLIMKKVKKIKKVDEEVSNIINEPEVFYEVTKKTISSKEFAYNDFEKILEKAPFTLAEWATMLHVSERTLQRYAKNKSSFAAIQTERILMIDNVLKEAKITFGKTENFYTWLKRKPYMVDGNISLEGLSTYEGIQNVLTQLGRIQNGITA